MSGADVAVKRIYEEPEAGDGERVLVDRLWPRGVRKDDAHFDDWCRDVAPSTELRKWYGHRPERFDEFARRYRAELAHDAAGPAHDLAVKARAHRVTLLTATRDVERSAAVVLAEHLRRMRPRP